MKYYRKVYEYDMRYSWKPLELWRDVIGFDNYLVSSEGRVMRKETRKILTPFHDSRGYCQLHLHQNGIRYTVMLHRLVAQAFIPNPKNKPELDHIDADKDNNRACNLRWVTRKENVNNPLTIFRIRENHPKGDTHPNFGKRGSEAITHKAVLQYSLEGEFIREWPSIIEASQSTGANHISSCCRGKRKSAGGYKWKHKE